MSNHAVTVSALVPHITYQQQLYQTLASEQLERGRLDVSQRIFATQLTMSRYLDNRLCLPNVPEVGSTLSGDDEILHRPLSLEFSAKVTLPDEHTGMSFTLHSGSNLGGLPNGTIIDYCNIYYAIEGNELTGYQLSELDGV